MDEKNSKRNGLIGTLIFHGVILAILIFCGLSYIQMEEEGVLVNFGNVNSAAGEFEPDKTDQPSPEPVRPVDLPPPPPSPAPRSAPEQVATQDDEESLAMKEADKKKKQQKQETKAKTESTPKPKQEIDSKEKQRREDELAEKRRQDAIVAEKKRQEQIEEQKRLEEERKAEAIRKRASGAFNTGSSNASQGDAASGTGNQGSPFGNSNTGANEGVGGYGTFALSGRSLRGQLPRPSYQVQEEGRIVVNITVDRGGNVIFAEIGRGTDIDSQQLRTAALTAAKQAKFNDVSQTSNQSGSITYRFNLR